MEETPRLPPNQQLIRGDRWPVVGEHRPREDDRPWQLTIAGEVTREMSWSLGELEEMATDQLVADIHCVTRWSRYDMRFTGVWLSSLLSMVRPQTSARFLSFVARSDRIHSTSLRIDEIAQLPAMIALQANDQPLAIEHGGPLRMVVPGRYFYKSVKWLERIDVLSEDRLGYWESETGYHNHADPWKEERFLAPSLDKRTAARVIAERDFSGKDLRSLDASKHDLTGLKARESRLRNANFCDAILEGADFAAANLSNARFCRAKLAGACFRDADLEGADFSGADLRDADLRGASLFGASFFAGGPDATLHALFDSTTKISNESLEALTDDQLQFVNEQLAKK